jgi:hypothetical protein
VKEPFPDQSLAFFSRNAARSESAMRVWTVVALLLVLAVLVLGGPA